MIDLVKQWREALEGKEVAPGVEIIVVPGGGSLEGECYVSWKAEIRGKQYESTIIAADRPPVGDIPDRVICAIRAYYDLTVSIVEHGLDGVAS